jgi:tetratricopeptide (TPR) repeat protein
MEMYGKCKEVRKTIVPHDQTRSFKIGSLIIDGRAKEARHRGQLLDLPETEFSVLAQLVERCNQVVLREEFVAWNKKSISGERHPVDNLIVKLRERVGPDFKIETVWGRGYRLTTAKSVERVVSPTASAADTLGEIASGRMKIHSGRSLQVSIRHYEEVLKAGPNAEAYGELAKAYINLGHAGLCLKLPQQTIPRAREVLAEALEYFPDLPSAYALRGLTKLSFDFDWQHASEDMHKALQLDADTAWAHCFLAHLDIAQGRFETGLGHARRAAELDPTTPMTVFTVPWMLLLAGHPDEAELEAARDLELFDPFPIGNIIHGYTLEAIGATELAITEYKRSLGTDFFPDALARLGHAYGTLAKRQTALSYLKELRAAETDGTIAYLPGYFEALIRVGLGEHDRALACLENSLKQHCDWLIYLNVEPCWKDLKKYERFKTLLQKVGLTAGD